MHEKKTTKIKAKIHMYEQEMHAYSKHGKICERIKRNIRAKGNIRPHFGAKLQVL